MPSFSSPVLRSDVLALLRCPVTGSALVQEGDELVASAPGPDGTVPRYPIEDGIPVLLPPVLHQES
ncbi:Trm112 family protein [Sinomonas sp. G460-2]|uniref:Trm112 family protein n=1 Tax=Sinomonas sp. G460-2 TaxID=3393464 RepID=UPI0039EF744D